MQPNALLIWQNFIVTKSGCYTIVLSLPTILSYPPTCIVISQTSVGAGRGCCFTPGSLCPIVRSVANRGLAPMVSGRWCYCDDVAHCLNPCWAKATSGGSCRTIYWIDSMIVRSLTTLKFGFRSWTNLMLFVRASDALDPIWSGTCWSCSENWP
jgi:hypothetical protein